MILLPRSDRTEKSGNTNITALTFPPDQNTLMHTATPTIQRTRVGVAPHNTRLLVITSQQRKAREIPVSASLTRGRKLEQRIPFSPFRIPYFPLSRKAAATVAKGTETILRRCSTCLPGEKSIEELYKGQAGKKGKNDEKEARATKERRALCL